MKKSLMVKGSFRITKAQRMPANQDGVHNAQGPSEASAHPQRPKHGPSNQPGLASAEVKINKLSASKPSARMTRANRISQVVSKQTQVLKQTMIGKVSTKTNYDHLALRDQARRAYKKVNEAIRSRNQPIHADMVFSDYMYKTDASLNKTRVIVLVTDLNLWVMKVDNYALINHISLKELTKILTIQTNSSIFALNFSSKLALFLESVRRTEFVLFLLSACDTDPARKQRPEIAKSLKLHLTSNNQKSSQKVISFALENQTLNAKAQTNIIQNLDSRDYILSAKYGYLGKKSKTWYKSWTERFYVLTDVGLIYMENPSDKDVKLFPFLDYEVEEVPEKVYSKKYVLQLKTIKGVNFDMVVQAYSK